MFGSLTRARNRARAGAEFLDANVPGWDKSVNLTDLRLSSGAFCVLGQLWNQRHKGGYFSPSGFEFQKDALGLTHRDAMKMGFYSGRGVSYAALDVAWVELLVARERAREQAQEQERERQHKVYLQRRAYVTYAENIEFAQRMDEFVEAVDELMELHDDTPRILTYSDIVAALPSEAVREVVPS